MAARSCYLRCVNTGSRVPMVIGTEKFVGRSPETNIRDVFCSRNQVSLLASLHEAAPCVYVSPVGTNASALNGFVMEQGRKYKAFHGDVLQILHNKYFHEIIFDPPPAVPKKDSLKRARTPETNGGESSKKVKVLPTPSDANTWESMSAGKLLVFTAKGVVPSSKIASYDIDGTIIKTKSGNVFPKSADDWQIAYSEVPGTLKKQLKDGFKVVFFTNQAGISSGKTDEKEWKKKLENIVQKLNIPVQVFVSTANSQFRKPKTGMWDILKRKQNGDVPIDLETCFYVGDAAGRPERKTAPKRKKDHSLADRLFALNLGIPFFTPEEHFQNARSETWVKPEFEPKQIWPADLLQPKDAKIGVNQPEIILMVGGPGSGKSHYAKTLVQTHGFQSVNQDTLKTWQNCLAALEECCTRKISAVVDNTNIDAETRKRYITVARKYNVPIRCFWMTTTFAHAKHNNAFREIIEPSHVKVSSMVLHSMKNKFVEPKLSEGFADIVRVNWLPAFDDPRYAALYHMYLLEK